MAANDLQNGLVIVVLKLTQYLMKIFCGGLVISVSNEGTKLELMLTAPLGLVFCNINELPPLQFLSP